MGGRSLRVPHRPGKTRLSPKHHHQWRGWVTHIRIDENPGLRGNTISASTRRAKETASLNVLRWYSKKRFEQRLGSGVMSRRVIRQQIGLVYILFSLQWNVEFILQSRTLSWCSQSSIIRRRNPPCNAKQYTRRTYRH